jgi:outer membrane protein assembly factor BamB
MSAARLTLRVFTRTVATAAGTLLCAVGAAGAAWELAHGDRANTGFADVVTAPAGKGSLTVPGLGTFAPGAGPVIAPDGTVYIGTLEGKLIALHADGRAFWSRDIFKGQSIVASPAIGADGSVYVVGIKKTTVRDHRGGKTTIRTVYETTLHKFTASGGWIAQTPFPQHDSGAATTAPPNIVRSGGVETVLVPAVYTNPPFLRVRLIAFSTAGAVVADQRVSSEAGKATGGTNLPLAIWIMCSIPPLAPGCLFGKDFISPTPNRARPPLPGVAIFTVAGGGAPVVIVSSQRHDIVGYTLSPGAVLTETFRVHDEAHQLTSPPVVLPDGQILIGTADGTSGAIVFAGPQPKKLPPVTNLGPVVAAPTRMADGRVIVVQTDGRVAVLKGGALVTNGSFPGGSIASAAASRTHVFVSTADAFHTFDGTTLAVTSKIDWVGGGTSPPAIGPKGQVYAIASNILFVFPPPR